MNESTRNPTNKMNLGAMENIDPMSHQEATQMNAVEMYVLNELTPDEELRFEAHYFECQECARAVAVEEALSEVAPVKAEPWWRRFAFPVLVPATAMLLAVVAFQNLQSIPSLQAEVAQLSEPQANTVITAHPVELGAEPGEAIKTPSVSVEFNLPPGAASPFYRVEISGDGKAPISQVIPAPPRSRVSLHILRERLGRGSFNVLLYGLARLDLRDGQQIAQYQFSTQ
jgi:hypothetical protein